jgi:hypothetical protein
VFALMDATLVIARVQWTAVEPDSAGEAVPSSWVVSAPQVVRSLPVGEEVPAAGDLSVLGQ